jgi:hypothetical protein
MVAKFGNGGNQNLEVLTENELNANLELSGNGIGVLNVDPSGKVGYLWSDSLNAYVFNVRGDWNSVKDAQLTSTTNEHVILKDFVQADVNFGGNGVSYVELDNAKRGNVTTGNGLDIVNISTLSNDAGWVNKFTVNTNGGADKITFTQGDTATAGNNNDGNGTWIAGAFADHPSTNGSFAKFVINSGAGADQIDLSDISAKQATITGGTGNDSMTASGGADLFVFAAGDASGKDHIYGFDGAHDALQLYGNKSEWHAVYTGGNTVVTHDAVAAAGRVVHADPEATIVIHGVDVHTHLNDWF